MPTEKRVAILEKAYYEHRSTSEELLKKVFANERSAANCIELIKEQYANFHKHLLGFLLVRMLEGKEAASNEIIKTENATLRKKAGYNAHVLPTDLEAEERYDDASADRYIAVFTERVSRLNQEADITLWKARFRAIFYENKWVAAKRKKAEALQKPHIVELVRALRWSVTDANELLMRLFDSDGFLGRSAEDLIYMFAIKCPEVSDDEIAKIREEYQKADSGEVSDEITYHNLSEGKMHVGTVGLKAELEELMSKESADAFCSELKSRKPYLTRNSFAARDVVKILMKLIINYNKDRGPVDPLETVKSEVDNYKNGQHAPDVFYEQFRQTVRFELFTVVYEKALMTAQPMDRRYADLISGDIPVQKNDILILLYYYASVIWKDTGNCDFATVKSRFVHFKNCANGLLEFVMLPKMSFYHATELAVLFGICTGTDGFHAFPDLRLLLDREANQKKVKAKEKRAARAAQAKAKDGEKQDQSIQKKCTSDGAAIFAENYAPLIVEIVPIINAKRNTVFRFEADGVRYWAAKNLGEARKKEPAGKISAEKYEGTPLELICGAAPEKVILHGQYGKKIGTNPSLSQYASIQFEKTSDDYQKNIREVHLRLVLNGLAAAVRNAVSSDTKECISQINIGRRVAVNKGVAPTPVISFNVVDLV